ncbi:uncharacterized protein GGS25DRAFT_526487 [Hypoxylon fragiforme]|uniref:uncharacterized protein n=1 Tax=Hypoxylon fragiforme TaxID=63214 RepID=UPI0020C60221|nr:uncharacterized protein GGS25DRAFT_526487 [Hypoxylon fragiforme]KAI2603452.1 hypothetical protein GGS25DRAFT_526487 [Hypoxylon fragiforme]
MVLELPLKEKPIAIKQQAAFIIARSMRPHIIIYSHENLPSSSLQLSVAIAQRQHYKLKPPITSSQLIAMADVLAKAMFATGATCVVGCIAAAKYITNRRKQAQKNVRRGSTSRDPQSDEIARVEDGVTYQRVYIGNGEWGWVVDGGSEDEGYSTVTRYRHFGQ